MSFRLLLVQNNYLNFFLHLFQRISMFLWIWSQLSLQSNHTINCILFYSVWKGIAKSVSSQKSGQPFLPAPRNISVVLTQWYPPAVRVNWQFDWHLLEANTKVRAFQIVYNPVKSRYELLNTFISITYLLFYSNTQTILMKEHFIQFLSINFYTI